MNDQIEMRACEKGRATPIVAGAWTFTLGLRLFNHIVMSRITKLLLSLGSPKRRSCHIPSYVIIAFSKFLASLYKPLLYNKVGDNIFFSVYYQEGKFYLCLQHIDERVVVVEQLSGAKNKTHTKEHITHMDKAMHAQIRTHTATSDRLSPH